MNMAEVISRSCRNYESKTAILYEGRPYSFAELDATVKQHASFLRRLGVEKGDRIAIQLPKCMDFIFLHLATLSLGAITLPLNPGYTVDEVRYFLTDSGSSFFFSDAAHFERVQQVVDEIPRLTTILIDEPSPDGFDPVQQEVAKVGDDDPRDYPTGEDDVAMICYTSGTTGKPKGAMITHRNLVTNTMALQRVWQWTDRDRLLHVLPLFHVHGLNVALHGGLNAGCTIVMHQTFDPRKAWMAIEQEKCTMFMAVPTIYYRLMNEWEVVRPALDSMRVFISGSGPLLENLFYRFEDATGYRILERYGMTEAQMITSNPFDVDGRIPQSVGFPLPGTEIRVVSDAGGDVEPGDVGEVWLRGDNIFKGYWQMPEKTRESFSDGWFRSGNLGYQDPQDKMRLYLVGRAKELIITGGYNVYPKELENVLESHEAVLEAAVVGIPDEDFGERVTAFVVLRSGTEGFSQEELIGFCKNHLAAYKCPKTVLPISELPRNAMGKIQKQVLQQKDETNP